MKKITKRLFPALAALMLILMSLLMPIRASAEAAPIIEAVTSTGAKITMTTGAGVAAGTSAEVALTSASLLDYLGWAYLGYKGATSLSDGLKDGNIQDWAKDRVMEWQYGYNQAQLNGQLYSAQLTYNDMQTFADLLDQAYPDGSVQVSAGRVVDRSVSEDFPVTIPMDTDIYFTDTSQDGVTATTKKLYFTLENADHVSGSGNIVAYETVYSLPDGEIISENKHSILSGGVVSSENVSVFFNLQLNQNGSLQTHLVKTWNSDGSSQSEDWYYRSLGALSKTTLISGVMPTFTPAEGVDVNGQTVQLDTDKLRDVPYGIDADDVALDIPLSDTDKADDPSSNPNTNPNKKPSEIIENTPDSSIDGDFSNLKLPKTIATVFPFCIPFDFYNGMKMFAAQPQTPVFEYQFQIPKPKSMGTGYVVNETVKLDFGKFEKLAVISRWLSTFGFSMLLINLSFKIWRG